MKITKSQLKQIIKEEIGSLLNENEKECAQPAARAQYLDNVQETIFTMWEKSLYNEHCKGTSLQSFHQDLLHFIEAVKDGRAEVPKRGGINK